MAQALCACSAHPQGPNIMYAALLAVTCERPCQALTLQRGGAKDTAQFATRPTSALRFTLPRRKALALAKT